MLIKSNINLNKMEKVHKNIYIDFLNRLHCVNKWKSSVAFNRIGIGAIWVLEIRLNYLQGSMIYITGYTILCVYSSSCSSSFTDNTWCDFAVRLRLKINGIYLKMNVSLSI